MNLKLNILLLLGVVVLGILTRLIVRAWRYRRDHPDEIYWPYNDMGTTSKREKRENEK
jgi:heme/copper-type cytochrome/quinol oxidase subunit 2